MVTFEVNFIIRHGSAYLSWNSCRQTEFTYTCTYMPDTAELLCECVCVWGGEGGGEGGGGTDPIDILKSYIFVGFLDLLSIYRKKRRYFYGNRYTSILHTFSLGRK